MPWWKVSTESAAATKPSSARFGAVMGEPLPSSFAPAAPPTGREERCWSANACPCAKDMGTRRRDARWSLVVVDWPWRLAYRVGFRLARVWWRLRRPDHDGAVVAVWLDGRILAVQQSYRSNLSWPGGGIRRGEEPREAARRELREELGLDVRPDDLVLAREMVA